MLYDITPPITSRLAVWPGDTPPRREVRCDLKRGDSVTLSTLHATVHLGAHADAPSHYGADAPAIDACRLENYLGPCQVMRLEAARGSRVRFDDLRLPHRAAACRHRHLSRSGAVQPRLRRPGSGADSPPAPPGGPTGRHRHPQRGPVRFDRSADAPCLPRMRHGHPGRSDAERRAGGSVRANRPAAKAGRLRRQPGACCPANHLVRCAWVASCRRPAIVS
jgi:hypothetical protein